MLPEIDRLNVNTVGVGGAGGGTGGALESTVSTELRLVTPEALAVMFAVPSPIADTTALLTEATSTLSLCHLKDGTGNAVPF
jgi:hypothetical protein